jgi:heat-inducible transcriptional repressor
MAAMRGRTLGPRQERVLAAIVEEHIRTAGPVGSKVVRDRYRLQVSTATIRNDMMALEAAGYIRQPHTSAGRVPSQAAYRYYVDRALERELPVSREWARVIGEFRRTRRDLETVLRAGTRLLSEVTHQPALASAPLEAGPRISRVSLRPVSSTSVRVDYGTTDGRSGQVLLRVSRPFTAEQIEALGQKLSEWLLGREVSGLAETSVTGPEEDAEGLGVLRLLAAQLGAELGSGPQHVYVDGAVHILSQPEFAERDRLTAVMATLDEEAILRRMLRAAGEADEVLVAIGTENPVSALGDCSLVAKSYRALDGRYGAIGVLGPMRMPYREIIATVRNVADRVGQMLGSEAEPPGR